MHSVQNDLCSSDDPAQFIANKLLCIVSHTNKWSFSWEIRLCNFLKEIYTKLCISLKKKKVTPYLKGNNVLESYRQLNIHYAYSECGLKNNFNR